MWNAIRSILLCVILTSCQITVTAEIPLSTLLKTNARVPTQIVSSVCKDYDQKKLPSSFVEVVCNSGGAKWRGSVQVVDSESKELVLREPLSVYYGSSGGIILMIHPNAAEAFRGMLIAKDIKVQVSIVNDTTALQTMVVSGVWVNGRSVGSEGVEISLPPDSRVILELSDVATDSLINGGMEGLALVPVK